MLKALCITLLLTYLLVAGTIAYNEAKDVVKVANARVALTDASLNE